MLSNLFKRVSTLTRINDQIYGAEKALIENQGTADHYQALAEGNRVTLRRLMAMRDADLSGAPSGIMTESAAPKKLRSAA